VQATLIHNPAAGPRSRAADLATVRALLRTHGWALRMEATTGPAAATALARDAVERGDDVVIVAGGDGTINEVIQALAGTTVALGVLPLGTVNVWAREIGLPVPCHPVAAAAALADGACRTIDLGRAGERFFLLMAGTGFDGAVTGLVEPHLKRAMGRWAYVVTAARVALRYGGANATLEMEGGTLRCRLLLAVIGNTRLYAGRFALTASAVADDGLLDVVVFPGRRLWQVVPRLLAMRLRRCETWWSRPPGLAVPCGHMLVRRAPVGPRALYYRTPHLRITADEPLPVQADGDCIGTTPMDFSVARSALRVIVPRGARTPLFSTPAAVPDNLSGAHDG
jgi:YegS/Rv2252/BmrU family lipid kinase